MNNTIEQILIEAERRRKMFHWFIDGIGRLGINWEQYKHLTPDWVTKYYNVNF